MRFGLIGCGDIGALRAQAIARLPGFELLAVSDSDPVRARHISADHKSAIEADWRELIRRDDIDAVVISTPPPLHAEMCIEALENSKHVLCEKPLARTPEECRQMLAVAQQSGRILATGFNYRFYPAIVKAREILDSGLIGELDHVRSYAGHPGGSEFTHPWVHDAKVMGGGALLDNGIHIIDLTRYFLGEVAEVKGYASDSVWGFPGCEDNGFALLKSPTGHIASVQASWSEWRGYRFYIEIYGTRGCVRASYPPMMAQTIHTDATDGRSRRRFYLFTKLQIVERIRSYRWTGVQAFIQELAAFARTVAGEKTPLALGKDGFKAVEIAHAVYSTSASGKSVRLDS
jgi:predicted dehydrogenase